MKIISVKAKDNALVFIDYVDDNGQEASTMIGAASIIANAEQVPSKKNGIDVKAETIMCPTCGYLATYPVCTKCRTSIPLPPNY